MSYVYNHNTGSVNYLPEPAAKAFVATGSALGWHGPFDTKEAVQKFYDESKAAHPEWEAPTGYAGVVGNVVPDTKIDPLGFGNLNFEHWLIRLAEIAVGMVLLGVGISQLSKGGKGKAVKLWKAVK